MKPDLYLLGEIWHDASQWLLGDEYDSVMNYPLMSGIHDFFLDRGMEKEEFEYMVNRCYTMYMQQSNNVMFNLLDSHDTQRLMSRFDDLDLFYQQLLIRTAADVCRGRNWIHPKTRKKSRSCKS